MNYFDKLEALLKKESTFSSDTGIINDVSLLEMRMVRLVMSLIGDREFPDDIRQSVMATTAINGIWCGSHHLKATVTTRVKVVNLRQSLLLGNYRELFKALAARKLETRFGRLTDDPEDMLKAVEVYDDKLLRDYRDVHVLSSDD